MKPFADLTNVEKVKSIYTDMKRPVSLDTALGFAGVALSDLTEVELDSLLKDPKLKVTFDDELGMEVRMYSPEDRSLVIQELGVDPQEVAKITMEDMWGDLFGTENDSIV